MNENIATINISLRDGTIEISGSEDFVSAHLAIFKDVIIQRFSKMVIFENKQENQIDNNKPKKDENEDTFLSNNYDQIFSFDEADVTLLLEKAPGSSIPEQTVNLALLYMFGKSIIGEEEISTDEIRQICKHYGCLDSGNFLTYLRKEKKDILLRKESNKKFFAELSAPGKRKAKDLAETLQNEPN